MELALRTPVMTRNVQDAVFDAGVLDAVTLERLRRRDAEAFGRVVDAYQARVFGFVRRMVPTGEDAEDVTQEVFLKAYRNLPGFDGRCSLRTWLFRIAHNLCIDRARRRVGVGSFPILGYDDLTAQQITHRLTDLTPAQLRKVRDYERRHRDRKSVLNAVARKLG